MNINFRICVRHIYWYLIHCACLEIVYSFQKTFFVLYMFLLHTLIPNYYNTQLRGSAMIQDSL